MNFMNRDIKIGVIGGDLRQLFCAKELAEKGYESAVFGFNNYTGSFGETTRCISMEDAVSGSNAVILPLPVSTNGNSLNTPFLNYDIPLDNLFSFIKKDQLVLAGHICEKSKTTAEKYGISLIDYYEREELQILNAIPTVEGALAIAINETPFTIHNAKCLVLGYGRVGKTLCHTLSYMGAKVTAAARKYSDFAWIQSNGYNPVHIDNIADVAPQCDIIFNTIPKLILGKELLNKIESRTLIIDLASKPGGVDFDTAKDLGLNVIWALSLPGKTAPLTSGKIICESIINILKEKGVVQLLLGYAMCGSFCNMKAAVSQLRVLAEKGHDIFPIMSQNTYYTDTKFGKAQDFINEVEGICGKKVIKEIREAEPIGPQIHLDCLCICPCTGNTLAKMAHGICDTSVTMAAKAHLRNERPLVIALASNDALSMNAPSLAIVLQRKNVYIVPFGQDDAVKKPRSAVCRFELIEETIKEAMNGKQIQPILWCDGFCY